MYVFKILRLFSDFLEKNHKGTGCFAELGKFTDNISLIFAFSNRGFALSQDTSSTDAGRQDAGRASVEKTRHVVWEVSGKGRDVDFSFALIRIRILYRVATVNRGRAH